ncbi:FAD-dependent oxidoreductase [Arthrobacter sp. AZCC_0090]|uniref:FAD-dependent oxidoreductase n=1 Tax=Arthrobacter sp. AZCC_0090 TaxID=2735881 RepID=UPI00161AA631|nr:FAD-dependent oxidoreductase [Arthrobacter sp. AZCC_0090]MBB6406601.1 2-polyprenyl-6-methoxyphenol hydroxylase-like FAD-dependent oxidoreductase [Arthrobacter sp. AZCC_0090]
MDQLESTTCVIAGGGPAGVMLGLLLARAGVDVTVLEKHADFLRDFRGDTVHPSTIRLLDELGLGEGFRALPQSKLGNFKLPTVGEEVTLVDFDRLKPPYDYVAMVPQWDLLNFLVDAAQQEPQFTLRMNTEATDLLYDDGGKVAGVAYRTRDAASGEETGTGELRATLTVACDGRSSVLRQKAGLVPHEFPVPFDTWWFRLSRRADEQEQLASITPRFSGTDVLLSLTRKDFYQIAYIAEKGKDAQMRAEGVESFRARVARLRPDLADRVDEIRSMDDLHMLDVKLNRIKQWHKPGLLLIGDAAHAMSPAGGVGINLAIQDAVAAAQRIARPLLQGILDEADLAAVQKRRWFPTVVIQKVQLLIQKAVFGPAVRGQLAGPPSPLVFIAQHMPWLGKLPAFMIAFGPRPEHAPDFARRKAPKTRNPA